MTAMLNRFLWLVPLTVALIVIDRLHGHEFWRGAIVGLLFGVAVSLGREFP